MIKNNKTNIILTSVLTLLPILAGVILWDRLPESIATHWSFSGEPDGFSSRGFTVFAIPLILLALHWVCIAATALDSKNEGQNKKVFSLILWIVPFISVLFTLAIYLNAIGRNIDISTVTTLFIGVILILIGNILPKCKQNRTIGIKIPTTLKSEKNWNATHRTAGRVWVISGFLLLFCPLVPSTIRLICMTAIFAVMVIYPIIYSYIYSKKED